MEISQSNLADQDLPGQHLTPTGDYIASYSPDHRRTYFSKYAPLHKAALQGDWKEAESILKSDPELYTAQITHGGETVLHLAAVEGHYFFVCKLLTNMEIHDTEIRNNRESTALCFAAAAGHVDIAKEMITKNPRLPNIRDTECQGVTPLYMAAMQGHKDMAELLLPVSDFASWNLEDQFTLLTTSIESGLYDLAEKLLGKNETLAVYKSNDQTALEVLAQRRSAFCANKQQGLWATIIGFLKCNKRPATCRDAYKLFDRLWDSMMCQGGAEEGQIISEDALKLPFIAAESGNDGFLVKLIDRYPDYLYKVNRSKHSIFHIAVKYRYTKIFNLIYELNGIKDLMTTYIDEDGENNILHLAAKLAPQNHLNGIPDCVGEVFEFLKLYEKILQLSQTFGLREVEKIVQPNYRTMKNSDDQTPYDLFLAEHGNLMKEGEKSMKQTAKSCMLVTLLITTLVFSTAFTLPGGYNDDTGAPILKSKRLFMFFPISQAVATFSSLVSMVMFLSVLTSRYKETDFLVSVPFWLVIGMATLLISIVAMMVEFCACLLIFQHGLVTVTIILALFASVPLMFVILNYSLLVTILGSTFGSRCLFRSENQLFS